MIFIAGYSLIVSHSTYSCTIFVCSSSSLIYKIRSLALVPFSGMFVLHSLLLSKFYVRLSVWKWRRMLIIFAWFVIMRRMKRLGQFSCAMISD
jgi:hypothetical protein